MQMKAYAERLSNQLTSFDWSSVEELAQELYSCWIDRKQVFLCGNGGSAGNAIHLANDFLYGIAEESTEPGMRVEALPANSSVLTCLANDIGYSEVFAEQIRVKANRSDLLIVLSGSGNSVNILQALDAAKKIGVKTCAVLGFAGGESKNLADIVIHFPINDMQISEDLQLVVGHMCMQYLHGKISLLDLNR